MFKSHIFDFTEEEWKVKLKGQNSKFGLISDIFKPAFKTQRAVSRSILVIYFCVSSLEYHMCSMFIFSRLFYKKDQKTNWSFDLKFHHDFPLAAVPDSL